MEKIFLYYDSGTCNYGDHDNGVEVFDTVEQAVAFRDKKLASDFDATFWAIRGVEIELPAPPTEG